MVEHWTQNCEVVGSSPIRSGRRLFFSRVSFLCWLRFRYQFRNETVEWLSPLPILMQESFWWWQYSSRCSVDFAFISNLHSWANCLCLHVIVRGWLLFFFYSTFLNVHQSGVLAALAWLLPHETAAISVRCVHLIQPCTPSHHAKPHM